MRGRFGSRIDDPASKELLSLCHSKSKTQIRRDAAFEDCRDTDWKANICSPLSY
jgi:hypothetical protein